MIFDLCVSVHIKVVFEVIFCFDFLNLSLYEVKYKCTFNVKFCIKTKVLNQFIYLFILFHNLCACTCYIHI